MDSTRLHKRQSAHKIGNGMFSTAMLDAWASAGDLTFIAGRDGLLRFKCPQLSLQDCFTIIVEGHEVDGFR